VRLPRYRNVRHQGCQHTLCVIVLSFQLSCIGLSRDGRDLLLVDLNVYEPLTGYSLDGGQLRLSPAPSCRLPVYARDVGVAGVLQNDGTRDMTARTLIGQELARFPRAQHDVNDIRLSPDGRHVAFSGRTTYELGGCHSGIAVARNGGSAWERAWCSPNDAGEPMAISWSPDAKRIAFEFRDHVYLLELNGGLANPLGPGRGVRWSPVGDWITFVGDADTIILRDANTHQSREIELPIKDIVPPGLEWSPDGKLLSVVSRVPTQPSDGRVRTALGVYDLQSGRYRDMGVTLWGTTPSIRWVALPARDFNRLAIVRAAACMGRTE